MFVDFLLPELLKEDGGTREEAKTRFDNWIQHGKRWAKLVEGPTILENHTHINLATRLGEFSQWTIPC